MERSWNQCEAMRTRPISHFISACGNMYKVNTKQKQTGYRLRWSIHNYNYYLVKHTQIVIHGLILHVHRSACTIHYDFKTPCEETQWKYLQNMCNFCKCLQVMCWRLRNMWKYVMKSKVMWENIPQGKCTHLCAKRKYKVCLDDFQSMTSQVSIQNDLRIFRS